MIKLINIDKYYNKGKKNSIHVVNNTSLELENKGLVTLLGASGSGKSTLLNVIAGLDRADGEIVFNDTHIKTYNNKIWDTIRADKIGFIFQHYNLLEKKTVYDNLKLVLNLIGINDPNIVDEKITYALEVVGLYKFRKKLASELSGGQKQRVAIARAIVKNPDVIIADEPTGNLDSVNSDEIARILRKIADEKLVILVTHNQNLANKFSDRIILLKDGVIVGDDGGNIVDLSADANLDDSKIYLQDLQSSKINDIKLFSDEGVDNINLSIIKINGRYYIKGDDNVKIDVIDNSSKIKLIDDTKKNHISNFENVDTSFSLENLKVDDVKRGKRKVFGFKNSLLAALRKMLTLGAKGKTQIIVLIILAIFLTTSIFGIFSAIKIDTSKIYDHKNVYESNYGEDISTYHDKKDEYILLPKSNYDVIWKIHSDHKSKYGGYDGFYESSTKSNFLPLTALENVKITNGKKPDNNSLTEVLVDETFLDNNYTENKSFKRIGIYSPKDFIGQKLEFRVIEKIFSNPISFKIVGTVKTGNKSIYASNELLEKMFFESIISNTFNLLPIPDDLKLVEGEKPVGKEVVINRAHNKDNLKVGDTFKFNGEEYKISGFFGSDIEDDNNKNDEYFGIPFYISYDYYVDILKNGKTLLKVFSINGKNPDSKNFHNLYENNYNDLVVIKEETFLGSIILSGVLIVLSTAMFYFFTRSSFMGRKNELKILRALGVPKKDVYKLYAFEYIIITTFTSLIGFLIGFWYVSLTQSNSITSAIGNRITIEGFIVAIAAIYLTNLLMALIPVRGLLKKTPAQMFADHDI